MCGIIGAIGLDDVVGVLYNGMCALQHRGQDAAGMLTFGTHGARYKKGTGRVDHVFSEADLEGLSGRLGIAHTRYPTAGSNVLHEDSHPIMVWSTDPLGMVHNGNIVNYYPLREMLKAKGVFLDTGNDVEVMAKIFAYAYERTGNPFEAVENVMGQVRGAYSVLTAIEGKGLLAFRDPHGIRPLALGRNEQGYCLASETVVFDQLGYTYERDIRPGEAVLIDHDREISSQQFTNKEHRPCMFEWVYFSRPDSMLEQTSVYDVRLRLGRELAREFEHDADVVIPAPDTARTAAMGFAEEREMMHREGLIKNRYSPRTFILPDDEMREDAVRIKLNPIRSVVDKKRVAVIDDSIVRGTTSKRIVGLLDKAGAHEVHFLASCPPITDPCYYGIDIPTKEELIASGRSVEEIRTYIGADSLTYLSLEGLTRAIGMAPCMACLTGEYPIRVDDAERAYLALNRTKARSEH